MARIVCLWMEGFFQVFQVTTEGGGEKRGMVFKTYCRVQFQNLKPLELTEAEILKCDVSISSDHLTGLF